MVCGPTSETHKKRRRATPARRYAFGGLVPYRSWDVRFLFDEFTGGAAVDAHNVDTLGEVANREAAVCGGDDGGTGGADELYFLDAVAVDGDCAVGNADAVGVSGNDVGHAVLRGVIDAVAGDAVGGAVLIEEVFVVGGFLGDEPVEGRVVAAGLVAEGADGVDRGDDLVGREVAEGETAFVVGARVVGKELVAFEVEDGAATGAVARRCCGCGTAHAHVVVVAVVIFHDAGGADLVEPAVGAVVDGRHIAGGGAGVVDVVGEVGLAGSTFLDGKDVHFLRLVGVEEDVATFGAEEVTGGADEVCLSGGGNFGGESGGGSGVVGAGAGAAAVDDEGVRVAGELVVAHNDVAIGVACASPAGAALERAYETFAVEDIDFLVDTVIDIKKAIDGRALLGVGAVDVAGMIAGGVRHYPLALEGNRCRLRHFVVWLLVGQDNDFGEVVGVEAVGGDEVAGHLGIFLICGRGVGGPYVHFQAGVVEFLDACLVEVARLNVDVEVPLYAPVVPVGPVFAGEELQLDVGIVGADVLQAGAHGGEDDAFVAEAVILDEFYEQGDVRAVVAVDAGCPFELDEGEGTCLLAHVEIFLSRAQTACILHAAACLFEGFGLKFLKGAGGYGACAAETGEVVVVAAYELLVFRNLEVGFDVFITAFASGAEGLNRVFETDVAAAVSDEDGTLRIEQGHCRYYGQCEGDKFAHV